jgi:hypothetical protein
LLQGNIPALDEAEARGSLGLLLGDFENNPAADLVEGGAITGVSPGGVGAGAAVLRISSGFIGSEEAAASVEDEVAVG